MNQIRAEYRRLADVYIPSVIIAHVPRIEYPKVFEAQQQKALKVTNRLILSSCLGFFL